MKLRRKPVDMPKSLADLLKAAHLETQPPEVAMGAMFGGIAHLLVAVWEQWPEGWPTFRLSAQQANRELSQLLASANPRIALDAILEGQKSGPRTIEQAEAVE